MDHRELRARTQERLDVLSFSLDEDDRDELFAIVGDLLAPCLEIGDTFWVYVDTVYRKDELENNHIVVLTAREIHPYVTVRAGDLPPRIRSVLIETVNGCDTEEVEDALHQATFDPEDAEVEMLEWLMYEHEPATLRVPVGFTVGIDIYYMEPPFDEDEMVLLTSYDFPEAPVLVRIGDLPCHIANPIVTAVRGDGVAPSDCS